MIIPIGHDKGIYRKPWLTGGIVVVCAVVFVATCSTTPNERELAELQLEEQELTAQLWKSHGSQWIDQHRSDLKSMPAGKLRNVPTSYRAIRLAFMRDFAAGKVVPKTHESHHTWRSFHQKVKRKMGLFRYAYQAGDRSITLVTYAFLHGGILHILGNMIFLLVCGCSLEDRWGRGLWGFLYLSGAVAAALSYGWYHNWDPHQGAVGASGAVAAAMGAFLITDYDARLRLAYVAWAGRIYVGVWHVPAFVALPIWLAEQFFFVTFEGSLMQVGYSAHIGGFVYGLLFALLIKAIGADRRLRGESELEATTVLQPQLYLEGVAHRERGDSAFARRCFERLLAQQPDHVETALELAHMAIAENDPQAAATAAARAIRNLKRIGDKATIRQVWTDLNRLGPTVPLDDRTLLAIAHVQAEEDPREALAPCEVLIERHADSPLRAKAMLQAATLHMELQDRNATRQMIDTIRSEYPDTAYAERAEQMLAEYELS